MMMADMIPSTFVAPWSTSVPPRRRSTTLPSRPPTRSQSMVSFVSSRLVHLANHDFIALLNRH